MRLTLRTLLSYLDNVLDEPSRKALEEQIEKGENASEWVHRTRDVMRRLKLGTPELHGSGSVDDPNTVAEYLDRTLPEEGVAEFERVCLESDVMLAEVASCHHVLAMVLTEQATIDPDTRKRLHRLQDDLAIAMKSRIEAPHRSPDEAGLTADEAAAAAPAPEAPAARRVKPEAVPGYLQEPESGSWLRWLPALAALLLLAVISGLAFGPGGWLSKPEEVAVVEPPPVPDPTPPVVDGSDVGATGETEPVDESVEAPAANESAESAEGDAEEGTSEEVTAGEESAEAEPADGVAADEPVEETTDATEDADTVNEQPSEETTADPETEVATVEPTDEVDDEPEVAPTMESLSGPDQLAVFLGPDKTWQRLQGGLRTDQESRLICMPTYRSRVGVAREFVVEMVGLTEVVINPKTPSVALSHGRIILSRSADADGPFTVELVLLEKPERHSYQVELAPGSVVAVAADRIAMPGYPVLEQSPPLAALAQVVTPPVSYQREPGGGAEKTEPGALFTRGQFLRLPDDYSAMEWVDGLNVTVPERLARPTLAQEVAFGVPVLSQALMIAREFDLPEVQSLAARCSLALGDAEPIAEWFDTDDEPRYWPVHFAELRKAASRSIAAANQVLRGFVVGHGENGGAALFELVAGFAPEQVGATPDELPLGVVQTVLVGIDSDDEPGLLDSRDLATRVLASLVLDELVVQEGQPYDPTARTRQRDRSVRLLRQALERQELQPK
ncbi:MAG: hypothetical protein AAF266_08060 [Planctomycetota bacterium]